MRNRMLGSFLAFACLALCAGAASAQYDVSWFTIDGGGGTSAGGSFALSGAIGQPDAGRHSGGSFALAGGFWAGGGGVASAADDGYYVESGVPQPEFRLFPARPNPVGGEMVLAFEMPEPHFVRVGIYDAAGRLVRGLAHGSVPAGRHELTWNRRDQQDRRVSAGVYFIRFEAGPHRSRQKVVVGL
jgi:hypothetical protein